MTSNSTTRYLNNKSIVEIFKNVPCKLCGVKYPPCVMDLHHRNRKHKIATIGKLTSRATGKLLKELEKCDVYCANCHRIITHS